MAKVPEPNEIPSSAKNDNFLFRILAMLGLGNDPDRERRQLLKDIKRNIKKNFSKYVNSSKDLAEPGLAKFFWEIYSVVGAAQSLLANAKTSAALKNIIIEGGMSERLHKITESLTEDAIRARVALISVNSLAEEVKANLLEVTAGIDMDTQKKIDAQYNLVIAFLDFIAFNYYFLLKKFDASLPEREFTYTPHFEPLAGDYIIEDLKDFLVVMQPITAGADWDGVFEILKAYKGMEVLSRPNWKKILLNINNMRKTNGIQNFIWCLGRDPFFKLTVTPQNERIVEPYLDKLKTNTELTLQKIIQEKKSDKISQLVKQVFGTEGISRTKFYTEKANMTFQKKLIGGYLYVEPLNYLKAFLLDYYKRDIRDLVNTLLVKAQWAVHGASGPFSESFHYMMDFAEKLSAFDESLADDAERGSRFKALLIRVERDSNAMASVKQMLKTINDIAKTMILDSGTHLVVLAKHLKACVDDYQKAKHEMILNWKQLESQTPKKLGEWMMESYKMLYYFIQLLQFFVKEN